VVNALINGSDKRIRDYIEKKEPAVAAANRVGAAE
jgi:hypothetical protein